MVLIALYSSALSFGQQPMRRLAVQWLSDLHIKVCMPR